MIIYMSIFSGREPRDCYRQVHRLFLITFRLHDVIKSIVEINEVNKLSVTVLHGSALGRRRLSRDGKELKRNLDLSHVDRVVVQELGIDCKFTRGSFREQLSSKNLAIV